MKGVHRKQEKELDRIEKRDKRMKVARGKGREGKEKCSNTKHKVYTMFFR